MKSRVVLSAGCCLVIAVAAVIVIRARPPQPAAVLSAVGVPDTRPIAWVEEAWANGEFVALETLSTPELRTRIRGAMFGDFEKIPSHKVDALVTILAAQLEARASPTVDAYLELIKADPTTRWTGKGDRGFHEVEYQWGYHGTGDQELFADPERRARWMIEHYRKHWHALPVQARLEPENVYVRTARIRTEEELRPRLWDNTPKEIQQFWVQGPGGPAQCLRQPKRQLPQVLAQQGATDIMEANMLLRSDGGKVMIWMSIWYWDNAINGWSLYLMGRRGWESGIYY
ncbi:MAG: hypothetical protein KF866_11560 [Phycisphaeraceae bacterium]|nr:hypothetical protein [Phycisphaeraceae bacterium]MCW5754191.1 hypothetical protein [Phycisphaeraceae bacterium]